MEITLQDVKQFLRENAGKDDVKSYLAEFSKVSNEQKEEILKEYRNSQDFKSDRDREITRAINTFKEKSMPGIIEEQVKSKADELEKQYNPPKNPAEEALRKQVETLMKQQQETDNEYIHEAVKTIKQNILSESGLPVALADYLYVNTKDLTKKDVKDLEKLKSLILPAVEPIVKYGESIKTGTAQELITRGTTAPQNSGSAVSIGQYTKDQLKSMTPAEINQARKDGKLNNILQGK